MREPMYRPVVQDQLIVSHLQRLEQESRELKRAEELNATVQQCLHELRAARAEVRVLRNDIERAITTANGAGSPSDAIQDMLNILRDE